MAAQIPAPAPQEKRFTPYMGWLAQAVGHADREVPLRNYCAGLLLDGERKSVEPMAARLAPDKVQCTHQSLHHCRCAVAMERCRHLGASTEFRLAQCATILSCHANRMSALLDKASPAGKIEASSCAADVLLHQPRARGNNAIPGPFGPLG